MNKLFLLVFSYYFTLFYNKIGKLHIKYIYIYVETIIYLHRSFGKPSQKYWSVEQSTLRSHWIRHGGHSVSFAQFVFRANENSHAICAEKPYDKCGHQTNDVSGIVKRLRHRENSGAQTALQQMEHRFRIAENSR